VMRLLEHHEDIVGEPEGFGSLLFESRGHLVASGTQAARYTTALADGRWTSWRRDVDLADLTTGPARPVLDPSGDDVNSVIHHVLELDDGPALAFYSNGRGVRAA